MGNKSYRLVYFYISVAMICWSLSFVWYKDAYKYFGPITTVFLRLVISAFILSIIALFTGRFKIERKHFVLFFWAAMFEPFLYFIGESYGMKLVSSVTASVIVATIPVFTPIISAILYSEKLPLLNLTGIIISFLGVGIVIFNFGFHVDASLPGVLLMFVAVGAAIGYAMVLRKLTPYYDALTIVVVQNIIGLILFAPLFFLFEWNSFLNGLSFKAMIPVTNLAIFASSLAFILFAYGVSKIGVSKANAFTNLIPVLTSIFSYFLLNEAFTNTKIVGICIVVSGLFLTQINFLGRNIKGNTN
jgi:drug/metabolite transporter (DMT)-like permease